MGWNRLFNPLCSSFPSRWVVNSPCLVLMEVLLCICMCIVYTLLQGPQRAWTWPTDEMEDIVCWRKIFPILYLLLWIQWGDKCNPLFYYCVTAVFLITAYQGLSDRDRKSLVVHFCYLYAKPLSVILSKRWLTPSDLPDQPGAHFSAQGAFIPQNGVGCFRLGHSLCLTCAWFSGTLNRVPHFRCENSFTRLSFSSWMWLFPLNSHHGPAEDLWAAAVCHPIQSQSTLMLLFFEHCLDLLAVSAESILWPAISLTAVSP